MQTRILMLVATVLAGLMATGLTEVLLPYVRTVNSFASMIVYMIVLTFLWALLLSALTFSRFMQTMYLVGTVVFTMQFVFSSLVMFNMTGGFFLELTLIGYGLSYLLISQVLATEKFRCF